MQGEVYSMTTSQHNGSIIHCCEDCSNMEDIKILENLVAKGIWECPKCGHPHTAQDFMEYHK